MFYQLSTQIKTKLRRSIATIAVFILSLVLIINPAQAAIDDDRYDGNVFVLYAGNGSLVPPRISLADSLKTQRPSIIVFYVDDSSDCKQYSTTVSQLQEYYGKSASFIPVTVDSLDPNRKYKPTEAGYYYGGVVPQTVLIDGSGKVRLNEKGQVPFERVDDTFRQVFDLLPREKSVTLKKRSFNEFNSEFAK
jgi:hypothetical protein